MFWGSHNPNIYLEIDNFDLFISKLKKRRDRFICEEFNKIPLKYSEIIDGVIYNPSFFCLNIKKFLQEHKCYKAKGVVCFLGLSGLDSFKKKLAILQVALCVCAAGVTIYKLLDKSILKKSERNM